jgi:hypothetical protein
MILNLDGLDGCQNKERVIQTTQITGTKHKCTLELPFVDMSFLLFVLPIQRALELVNISKRKVRTFLVNKIFFFFFLFFNCKRITMMNTTTTSIVAITILIYDKEPESLSSLFLYYQYKCQYNKN